MKLSTRARYALRMMVEIARQANGSEIVSLADVADSTRISRRYLEQLVIALKHASLVRGITGKKGGYVLTRPARDITLGQIIEAAIGPINIVECVLRPENCLESDVCECRWVYQKMNEQLTDVLETRSLNDLVERDQPKNLCWNLAIEGSSCPTRTSNSVGLSSKEEE